MKWLIFIASVTCLSGLAWADDLSPGAEVDRDPASISIGGPKKKTYPGGADEEDLRVLPSLPEAAMKTDSRTLQREVYKQLYNQELKEEKLDEVEE